MSVNQTAVGRAMAARRLLQDAFPEHVTTVDATSEYETERDRPWYVLHHQTPVAKLIKHPTQVSNMLDSSSCLCAAWHGTRGC